ncbi:MAG: ribokinase [Rhizobiales bacterium]|nr:ribokinase [Hyphomicrobiales bacterium]MBI3672381.1 ribokinase [Hyphomicrobiales bacterium]
MTEHAVVVGSVHMDLIATADRLPRRGESVAGGRFSMSPGGKGCNQACQLVLAGVETKILTRLGDDFFGRRLLEALAAKGVDTSLVAVDGEFATGASTVLAAEGDYCSIIASGAAAELSPAMIDKAAAHIRRADALLLQLELPVAASLQAAALARGGGTRVVLNASPAPASPNAIPRDLWRAVSILVVNRVEASRLLGQVKTPRDIGIAAADLARTLGIETVVVTGGAAGSAAAQSGGVVTQPAFPAEVVDTVGAGDAYLGTLVAGLLQGHPIELALRRAAAAGAIVVSRRGAHDALPGRDEVDAFLSRHSP